MANVEYLICSFCQGPSSRSIRRKLAPHLSDPLCRIRPSDLDWLDQWRLLLPSHVEWDLHRLQDVEFQNEYERELPKTNVISKITWVPSIEGRISSTPESDDLDGWRTIEFHDRTSGDEGQSLVTPNCPSQQENFKHLLLEPSGTTNDIISKRTLHAYNDDIDATRLPFHSACLRILYESCNEVVYSTYATSTVSDVVASILLPSWKEGDVNMDWLSSRCGEIIKPRLIAPWGEHWHPLDPLTNFLAVDPSRPHHLHHVQSVLIHPPQRIPFQPTSSLPPLLRMPAEVIDLISDFVMDHDPTSSSRPPFDPYLEHKVRSLQNLRCTCRQLYHHSFPRIHFLSFLHAECNPNRGCDSTYKKFPAALAASLHRYRYLLHLPQFRRPYLKPLLPYRRTPALPPFSAIDRTVMEINWESMYRSWKEGLGWKNRVAMFVRCETWLSDMQEEIWSDRPWGRTANYVITQQQTENVNPVIVGGGGGGGGSVGAADGGVINMVGTAGGIIEEDEEMQQEEAGDGTMEDLDQFQWP